MEEMSFELFVKESRETAKSVVKAACYLEGRLFDKAGAVL